MLHARHCTAAAFRRLSLPPGLCARRSSPQHTTILRKPLKIMEVDRPQAANGEASTSGKQARNFPLQQLRRALGRRDRVLKHCSKPCRGKRQVQTTTSTPTRTSVGVAAAGRSLARHVGEHCVDRRGQHSQKMDKLSSIVTASRHTATEAMLRHVPALAPAAAAAAQDSSVIRSCY
jgi:hypothetical protein